MTNKYILNVVRFGKKWCSIEFANESLEDVKNMILRFPESEGYSYHLCRAHEVRRIIESSSSGIVVLGSIFDYENIKL